MRVDQSRLRHIVDGKVSYRKRRFPARPDPGVPYDSARVILSNALHIDSVAAGATALSAWPWCLQQNHNQLCCDALSARLEDLSARWSRSWERTADRESQCRSAAAYRSS